jgi:hypothetical protein
MLYQGKNALISNLDIILLKQLALLGPANSKFDFRALAKINKLNNENRWTLSAISGLFT